MTPIDVSLMLEGENDQYVSLSGPEGYVCMDAEAARSAGEALVNLAAAMEGER